MELKDITKNLTWVIRFPDAKQFGEDAVKEEKDAEGEIKYIIQGITMSHRVTVGILTLARLLMTCVLTYVGISYLLKSTDYIGLLMDAVALVFIVEIANIIYSQVLRDNIREQCESLDPMTVDMY